MKESQYTRIYDSWVATAVFAISVVFRSIVLEIGTTSSDCSPAAAPFPPR